MIIKNAMLGIINVLSLEKYWDKAVLKYYLIALNISKINVLQIIVYGMELIVLKRSVIKK